MFVNPRLIDFLFIIIIPTTIIENSATIANPKDILSRISPRYHPTVIGTKFIANCISSIAMIVKINAAPPLLVLA